MLDFVFCGYLLLAIKDPIAPVENIYSACTGRAVIVNVVKKFRMHEKRLMTETGTVSYTHLTLPTKRIV